MSDLQWRHVRRFQESEHSTENLEALGIRVLEPRGHAVYQLDDEAGVVKKIGTMAVYSDGRITAAPFLDTTPRELRVLLSLCVDAFRGKLKTVDWWTTTRGGTRRRVSGWWVCVDDADPVARVLLAARHHGVPLFWNEAERHAHVEKLQAETERAT